MKKSKNAISKLALFGASLIWGSSFFVVKNSVDIIDPHVLLGLRFTIACLLLFVIFYKKFKQLSKEYFVHGFFIGLFLFLGYSIQTIGIGDTTPGKNAFLSAFYCVLVPFILWVIDKKIPSFHNFSAAFICITGIGLVSITEHLTIGKGDALSIISGIFYAAHMIAISKFSKDKDPVLLTILQFGYAAVFSWIIALLFEEIPTTYIGTEGLISVLYLAVFATAGALLLQNIGQKHTKAAPASIILSLEAVFGVLFSVIFYGEAISAKLYIGFFLIFIAVIISETKLSFLKQKKVFDNNPMTEDVPG